MAGLKSQHWIAIGLTLVLVVLLLLAPHHSGKFESEADLSDVPTVENEIDSALFLINGEQPMQGILMLRSIAEEHPENFRAQYHLGRFSAQTGQWQKVIERFEIVKKIDPEFAESEYWIGLANLQLGNTEIAKTTLERFLEKSKENSELEAEAQKMLNNLN